MSEQNTLCPYCGTEHIENPQKCKRNQLTCPKCGDPLRIDEEWRLIKPWLKGTRITGSIQGDYAHERCL